MLSVQKKDTGIGFEVSGHELTCIIMGGGVTGYLLTVILMMALIQLL